MKKIMFLIGLFITLIAKGQFSLQPRIGVNENAHSVFALDIAYRVGCLEPAVIIDDVQHNTEAAYFSFRIGFRIPSTNEDFKVMLIGGQSYRYMSNDKLNENYWLPMAGIRLEKHLNCMIGKTAIFGQVDYSDQFQFTLGLKL